MLYHLASLMGVALIAAGLLMLLLRPIDEKFLGLFALAGGFALVALAEVSMRPRRRRFKASASRGGHYSLLPGKTYRRR